MAEDRFKIVFGHMDKEIIEQTELQTDAIRDALEQSSKIKELIEIIDDATPIYEPLLYSSS